MDEFPISKNFWLFFPLFLKPGKALHICVTYELAGEDGSTIGSDRALQKLIAKAKRDGIKTVTIQDDEHSVRTLTIVELEAALAEGRQPGGSVTGKLSCGCHQFMAGK